MGFAVVVPGGVGGWGVEQEPTRPPGGGGGGKEVGERGIQRE